MSAALLPGPDLKSRRSAEAFILANTKPLAPPLVPEITLLLAEESLPIWQKTEEELGEMNVPPPYWAFAWAGGQALARLIFSTGRNSWPKASSRSRLGIGALPPSPRCKRRRCAPCWRPTSMLIALAAIGLNAAANNVAVAITGEDLLAARSGERGRYPRR